MLRFLNSQSCRVFYDAHGIVYAFVMACLIRLETHFLVSHVIPRLRVRAFLLRGNAVVVCLDGSEAYWNRTRSFVSLEQ